MMNEATIQFVQEHRNDDVRTLALQSMRNKSIDMPWALDQIRGWQTACKKLPSWAATQGLIYPPHLSMEQCSSEKTAMYKCEIVERLPESSRELLVDLTGGFGVDFSFMARHFKRAIYVERQEGLCDVARHNFAILGLDHASILRADAISEINDPKLVAASQESTWFYLDPARRNESMARTYAITDCSPNVLDMLPQLFKLGHHVLLKLSPMLDWHKAVSDLGVQVSDVHILSVGGECKELLILMSVTHDGEPTIHCVNDNKTLVFNPSQDTQPPVQAAVEPPLYLYEPNASIMKAGCFGVLCQQYPVKAIAVDSHLFASNVAINDFPGRGFAIKAVTTMNKKELRHTLSGISQANVAVRNFPLSAQQLRSRLGLKDGGDIYIFGSTDSSGRHLLYIGTRA